MSERLIILDQDDVKDLLGFMARVGKESSKLISRAINKSIGNTRTESTKLLGRKINLKAARIKEDFKRGTKLATFNDLTGRLSCDSQPTSLISDFNAVENKTYGGGVTAKIYKDEGKRLYKGAFIAKNRGGIFVATRDKKMGGKWVPKFPYATLPAIKRMPIGKIKGPRISALFENIQDQMNTYASDRLQENLEKEAIRVLRGY